MPGLGYPPVCGCTMGLSPLLSCLLWTAIFGATVAQTPMFLVMAPRLLHVGVQEAVWVQMVWPPGTTAPSNDITVTLYLRNQKTMAECTTRYEVTLKKSENHIKKQTIELSPQRAATCKLEENRSRRYLQLVATSHALGGKPHVVSIPVSYKKGYLFIQTDKSIYTPKESVNIRVFTLDHMMRPTDETITATVINAEDLQVGKEQQKPKDSIVSFKFQIPDISTTGTWKVSAHFSNAPESNSTAEFEVRKYVLPNFEVKIVPELPYFLITKTGFQIKVEARYVYGENVDGITYVRVGVIDPNGKKTILQGLEKQVKMEDGAGIITVSRDDIVKKIGQPAENLVGSFFYISASVMEKASGTLEEKEVTSVKFVTSPYKVDLSKTKKYFIPGSPTQIVVDVRYTDDSPANDITVKLFKSNELLDSFPSKEGTAVFQINTKATDKSLDLTVKLEGKDGKEEEKLRLTPYSSTSNSFLLIDVPNQVLQPGENLKVTLKAITPHAASVGKIYYMVMNKGQILDVQFLDRSDFMTINIPVTTRMIPSFRIVAYYFLSSELVANSVWVDVTDECEGKLYITTNVVNSIQPSSPFQLTVETDDKMSVSLSAVDTAVYLLNSKNKMTPGKVFKAMNDYDLGCSPGGGRDFKSVFMDAGVAFVCSAGYSDLFGFGCREPQRKKRSLDFASLTKQKMDIYSPNRLKQCCKSGMTLLNQRMDRNCKNRASRVLDAECSKAFLDCCTYAEDLRKKITLERRKQHTIGRTQKVDDEELEFVDESEVNIRSKFPESWLWKTIPSVNRKHTETLHVPDSITTWEIQGIGMSKEKGFCVAAPAKVKVFKEFHIHMRVPYSVKRMEQVELRPVLYNYYDEEVMVKVYMKKVEDVCSPTNADGNALEQIVTVAPHSAQSVPFTLVPIGETSPVVTVMALGLGSIGISDAVEKVLRIEREGVAVVESQTFVMDPQDRKRNEVTVAEDLPSNVLPDGGFRSSIKISVDSPINTINNSLSADGVSKLIWVPRGCAEQTMITTAPGVYAIRYLDHTEKWETLPPGRKDEGLENMKNGYTRILQYRKPDGSYGAWLNRPSSTWLTSFVMKVMSLCHKYIQVDEEEIRKTASYLTTKQTSTGAFQETNPVIHTEMTGGVFGKNAEVSLTAYVLIALHHAAAPLSNHDITVKSSIGRATDYLRNVLDSVSDPYPLAVTAYALALTSSDSALAEMAYKKFLSVGLDVSKLGQKGSALVVETASYGLLAALAHEDLEYAKKLYTWLSEQQNYGGGFKSTQDTVMALEALSEYWIGTYEPDRSDKLEVFINSLERSQSESFTLRSGDSVLKELRSLGKKFKVKFSGKGRGTVTILKRYNVMQPPPSSCSELELGIKVHGEDAPGIGDNDYNYDYEDDEAQADEPLQNIHWHDLRSRARREVSKPKDKQVKVDYDVTFRRKDGAQNSGMAIVDITLLSGFEPSIQDLNKLKDGPENYISHYEVQGGKVILYFDKVTDKEQMVSFEAYQTVKVSPLQPASALLYDFYEPDKQCRKFYNAPSRTNFISTLCSPSEGVCQCAGGPCPKVQQNVTILEDKRSRRNFACYSPRVVNALKVTVEEIKTESAFKVYKAKIVDVLQTYEDVSIKPGEYRYFYQREACKMNLEKKDYLIMGQDGKTTDGDGKMRYFLENKSWIEELATTQECKATRNRNKCNAQTSFMDDFRVKGCNV
ncbi:complement C4-B-like [Hyperolius riggenbachi]|uniref:complement C4-B-like n=1 Tax=Hyperolius riggenbachi TaxID=752182 RepID=UPI0035A3753F